MEKISVAGLLLGKFNLNDSVQTLHCSLSQLTKEKGQANLKAEKQRAITYHGYCELRAFQSITNWTTHLQFD